MATRKKGKKAVRPRDDGDGPGPHMTRPKKKAKKGK
jgi:hypothetical protein